MTSMMCEHHHETPPDQWVTTASRSSPTSTSSQCSKPYFEERMTERAVFSLFVRRLPPRRNFLIACGLNAVLDYLESLHFTQQDLTYLDSLEIFSDRFLAWLDRLPVHWRHVHAMREGTPVFANEPIPRGRGPIARGDNS